MGELQKAQQRERDEILGALWQLLLTMKKTPAGHYTVPMVFDREFQDAAHEADKLVKKIRGESPAQRASNTRELFK